MPHLLPGNKMVQDSWLRVYVCTSLTACLKLATSSQRKSSARSLMDDGIPDLARYFFPDLGDFSTAGEL